METRTASALSSRSCWKVRSAFSTLVLFPLPCLFFWFGGCAFALLQQGSVVPLGSACLADLLQDLPAAQPASSLAMAQFCDDKC